MEESLGLFAVGVIIVGDKGGLMKTTVSIPARTKSDAQKKATQMRKRGHKPVVITKIDERALAYRQGNRYWVSY